MKPIDPDQIEKLVIKAQKGNPNAYGELYKLLASSVYRFCIYRTKSHEEAQDVVSETFKRVWCSLDRYKTKNFKAYLFTTARNLIINQARKNKKQAPLPDALRVPDNKPGLEENLLKKSEKKMLHQAISKLPPRYRDIVVCRYIEELSIKDTSDVIGISAANVRVIQHRAIKKLQTLIK